MLQGVIFTLYEREQWQRAPVPVRLTSCHRNVHFSDIFLFLNWKIHPLRVPEESHKSSPTRQYDVRTPVKWLAAKVIGGRITSKQLCRRHHHPSDGEDGTGFGKHWTTSLERKTFHVRISHSHLMFGNAMDSSTTAAPGTTSISTCARLNTSRVLCVLVLGMSCLIVTVFVRASCV